MALRDGICVGTRLKVNCPEGVIEATLGRVVSAPPRKHLLLCGVSCPSFSPKHLVDIGRTPLIFNPVLVGRPLGPPPKAAVGEGKEASALWGGFLSERSERNRWPRPPSLAPLGQFTLRIAGGKYDWTAAVPPCPSSSQSPLDFISRWRGKLRPLPCSSSSW